MLLSFSFDMDEVGDPADVSLKENKQIKKNKIKKGTNIFRRGLVNAC